MLYLDTSLVVAALTNETTTAEIQDWLARQSEHELVISDWVMTEFSSALSIKVRTGQLGSEHRADALAFFRSMAETTLTVIPISRSDFTAAARFSDRHETGLRAGDALHLAVVANHGFRLVSLDRLLNAAARELGVSTQSI
jgi:hypothetical protein